MRLVGLRAKVRPVEWRSVESADDGVKCQAVRVLRAAVPQVKELPVKLQSAWSTPGRVAGLLNVATGLMMCRL
jgi:hypothetical protein